MTEAAAVRLAAARALAARRRLALDARVAGARAGSAAGVIEIAIQLALAVIPAILAITLHEAAHGYAALALGDDTARRAGRLSLNPLRHVDRVGTILLPGFLLLFQLLTIHRVVFMFGWAKPVPVSAWKFRDPRRGMAVVAVAGPAMNFFLAWVGALLLPVPTVCCRQRRLSRREHRPAPGGRGVPVLFHPDQPGAGPVQPAADPAAGRRPHRGRPAAAGAGAGLGAGWSGSASCW